MIDNESLRELRDLHAEVDSRAAAIAHRAPSPLKCARGCHTCCIDELTVLEVEAARILIENNDFLVTGKPHRTGLCAMLGHEGECRVYSARPYICRTQGLPFRFFAESVHDAWELDEVFDICPLNLEGHDLSLLDDAQIWTLGPTEERLMALQSRQTPGLLPRVALRDLFEIAASRAATSEE